MKILNPSEFVLPPEYSLVESVQPEEVFLFLQDLYAVQGPDSRLGGRWTRSLVALELQNGGAEGVRDKHGFLRSLVLYRWQADHMDLTILGTSPKHRGKGLMSAVFCSLKQRAQRFQGAIYLEVHSANLNAQKFYDLMGFRLAGVRSKYYHDGGDAIVLSWHPQT